MEFVESRRFPGLEVSSKGKIRVNGVDRNYSKNPYGYPVLTTYNKNKTPIRVDRIIAEEFIVKRVLEKNEVTKVINEFEAPSVDNIRILMKGEK